MQVKNKLFALSLCIGGIFAGLTTSCGSRQITSLDEGVRIRKMNGSPMGEDGISKGVSACYAGILDNQLVMAGGCNFPEIAAAEGGGKRYYKGIYAASLTSDSVLVWQKIGELPVPAAYGVSVTTPQGVICVGGTNSEGALSSVYRLSQNETNQSVKIEKLPSLPCTLDNMGGSLLNNVLYVSGGNANGKPTNRLFAMNLSMPESGWQELPSFPGNPRVQPVCVGLNREGEEAFYMWGGFAPYHDGQSATLALDGYVYSPSQRKWTSIATPIDQDSISVSLGGGTAIALNDSMVMCMGGVNKDIFLSALQREEQIKKAIAGQNLTFADSLKAASKEYMLQSPEFYQFNDRILVYNARRDEWKEMIRTSETARAGAVLVGKGKRFFSINGELKPGIRTPEIVEIVYP